MSREPDFSPEPGMDPGPGMDPEPGMSAESGVGAAPTGGTSVPSQKEPAEIERRPGVLRTILGRDQDDEDQPLPDFPPLPEDPRWRIEHMPLVVAVGFALVFCAASVGFLVDGTTAALGAAAGVLVVTIGYSMTTLAIAWADALRPTLVMPIGLAAYVIKYILIAFIMVTVAGNGWTGGIPMAWGIAAGAVLLTGTFPRVDWTAHDRPGQGLFHSNRPRRAARTGDVVAAVVANSRIGGVRYCAVERPPIARTTPRCPGGEA